MSRLLSTNFIYSVSIGLTVWITGINVAIATPIGGEPIPNNQTNRSATGDASPLKVTNSLASGVGTDANNDREQIDRAAAAVDIKPGDWAYQTLQSLSTKYRCANAPTGSQTLSREEFATSLNTCIQSVEQLVARKQRKPKVKKRRAVSPPPEVAPEPTPEVLPPPPAPVAPPAPPEPQVSQQDLDQIKQLIEAFQAELKGVDGRLTSLDGKVTALKDQSFSTTTKLVGEAIFAVTGLAGGPATASRNTIFSDRVRLNFRSSFSGKDLLLVRLQARNSNSFAGTASGTNMTRLGFEGSEENTATLHRLQYQLPLAPTTKVFVEAVGSEFNDNYYTFNPEHQAAGTGSVTRFGRFNPIYRLSNEGAGIGVDHKFSPNLGLVLSYAVPRVVTPATPPAGGNPAIPATPALESINNPANGSGLFNGSNVLFSQLTVKPSDDVSLGIAYARSYNSTGTGVSGNNGSNFANNPFNSTGAVITPTTANHYSVLGSVNLSKDLIFSAWGGLTQATRESGGAGTADIWNYAATLAAKDFGSKGSTLGFVVGMQPKVTSNSGATAARVNTDTSLHIEAFYKYKVSDNLFITPGLLMLTNPEHNAAIPTEYLGTIRTTFSF
jgi:Carbohydrate-selective porin, OprB family